MFGLKTYIRRQLNAFERRYDYDMAYCREILDTRLKSFMVFSGVFKLAGQRDGVPVEPWLTAKWVAVHSEDCGPCQQLIVNMSLEEGLSPELVQAITRGDVARMPPDVALVYQWASSVVTPGVPLDQADAWREQIVARWGQRGLVSLTLAMAGGRSFPMIKRALGHSRACQAVRIPGSLPRSHQLAEQVPQERLGA